MLSSLAFLYHYSNTFPSMSKAIGIDLGTTYS